MIYANSTWVTGRPAAYQLFFAQVGCTAKDGETGQYMKVKMHLGLLCSTIGLLMCIYF